MKELAKKHAQKIRFGIVGLANTGLDFVILFILTSLGLNAIVANYISTGIAFIFSFIVNKKFTFRSNSGSVKKQFGLFLIVTMIGLWVIQPIVIYLVTTLLTPTNWNDQIILFGAKVIATVASLVWNYLFYSRLVFKKVGE